MQIETNVALDETTVIVDKQVEGTTAVISVRRYALVGSGGWTVTAEVDPADPAVFDDIWMSGDFGDGAWFADVGSQESVTAEPFVVMLSSKSQARWYRLGPWGINGSDPSRILLSRSVTDGLEIAAIDAPT
jgi:hypothetical protein